MQPEAKPKICVEDLEVTYGDRLVLKDICFSVNEGEIFAVMGGSGAGKSTLLRHMLGLESPAKGRIIIKGVDITTADDKTFFATLKNTGVLFQSSALIGSMTIAENVALPIIEYTGFTGKQAAAMVMEKLSMVGLENFAHHLPSELSGGMKKRAGLARAMALNPDILFLDEPSAGLDPVTTMEIDKLIVSINRLHKTTIIMITHNIESVLRTAQRIILLDSSTKTIIADGEPRKVMNESAHPGVKKFFEPVHVTSFS